MSSLLDLHGTRKKRIGGAGGKLKFKGDGGVCKMYRPKNKVE